MTCAVMRIIFYVSIKRIEENVYSLVKNNGFYFLFFFWREGGNKNPAATFSTLSTWAGSITKVLDVSLYFVT